MDTLNTIPTRIYALGGVQEIGKNMYGIDYGNEILIIDCGVKFAGEELLGVNLIIPSFDYLKQNESKIKCLFLTHGHEDHIGAVPFLLMQVKIPKIIGSKLTLELVKKKLSEYKNIKLPEFILINDESKINIGIFKMEFFTVCHSIPDAYGCTVWTPNGTIATAGDYRVDFTPLSDKPNISKMAELGDKGISVFLSESTNSERPGFSQSESDILISIRNIFQKTKSRIILSTFASNLGRIEEIAALAINYGRKVCILGRSMTTNIEISQRVGYLTLDKKSIIEPKEINQYPDKEILILSTGSQGEDLAALNIMSLGKHAWVHLKPTDVVILSSNPIPGNLSSVERLINQLYKAGVTVLVNSPFMKLHASGHATKQEQQLVFNLLKPKYLFPIHGEYRMLKAQQQNAYEIGIPKENTFICSNGDIIELLNGEAKILEERVTVDEVYVDGNNVVGLSNAIIRDRKTLSKEGMFAVSVTVDIDNNKIVGLPQIISRGSFYTKDSIGLIIKVSKQIKRALELEMMNKKQTFSSLKNIIKNSAAPIIWKEKRRNPLIIPSILKLQKFDESMLNNIDKLGGNIAKLSNDMEINKLSNNKNDNFQNNNLINANNNTNFSNNAVMSASSQNNKEKNTLNNKVNLSIENKK